MHLLTRFSLRRVSIVIMLMLFVLAGGIYSATQLKSELLPNIDLPVISVVAVYPGAAPDDVRRDISEPIEKAIAGTANLKNLTSRSDDSLAFISAEYEYGTNMEKTQQNVQDAINGLTLPSQVQRPTVGRFSFQDIPVLAYTINTNDQSADALATLRRNIEDNLVPDLKAIPGVNSVEVAGGGDKQVAITFDQAKLEKDNLTASSIIGILQANNISFPTGQIVTGGQAIPVRVGNQFNSVDDLKNVVVRPATSAGASGAAQSGGPPSGEAGQPASGANGGGAQSQGRSQTGSSQAQPALKLGDVAGVALVDAGGTTISRSNGEPSLALIAYKTQNANTVQVADAISKRVAELKSQLPGTSAVVLFDQATYITDSLNGLIREGLIGAALAIIIILLFLRSIRSTLVTAMSIPMSVLIAFIMLNVFGISLNIMSLAGLAVAIGRVVDDSIVVLENIYRHHFQNGEPLRDAAYNGTKEVATAITASTITTVCVFLPLGFIAGLVSEFFRPFAIAVTVSLLASLIVALTVIPVLAVLLLKTGVVKERRKADEGAIETKALRTSPLLPVYKGRSAEPLAVSTARTPSKHGVRAERDTFVQRLYTPLITWALSKRWTKLATLGVALLLFAGSLALTGLIPVTFINFGSDKVLNAEVTMKPGTDLKTTDKASMALETEIQKHPGVLNYQTTIGSDTRQAQTGFGSVGSDSVAKMTVTLAKDADVRQEADWLRNLISSNSKSLGIDDYTVTPGSGGGPNSSGYSIIVSGDNYGNVVKASDQMVAKLKSVPNLVNITSDAARAKPEIRVDVDPAKALEHGSTTIQIASQVRSLLTSQKVTNITIGGRNYDVEAMYDQNTLNNLSAIKSIKVGTVNPVALSEVASVTEADGPVSINRINQQRSVTVQGTINSDNTSGVAANAQKAIDQVPLPPGVKLGSAGVTQEITDSFQQLITALIIAVVLVYLVMVVTFGSLSTPFVIMFSLPLAAIGSIVALYVTGRPLGVSAMIGILMLVGIVVTNAIVLLDLVEQYERRGYSTHDALIQGGRTRVRPIIMTAIATIIALMPLALGFSEGSIIAAELGTVVVGGLFTSTFLTLIVVPVVYSLLDSVRRRLGGNKVMDVTEIASEHRNGKGHNEELDKLAPSRPEPAGV